MKRTFNYQCKSCCGLLEQRMGITEDEKKDELEESNQVVEDS